MSMLFPILLMAPLLFIMFWSSRKQQKKAAAAIAELKKGDRVLTQSGLVGKLVEVAVATPRSSWLRA
jgi:preprotein translocase subunit YajC